MKEVGKDEGKGEGGKGEGGKIENQPISNSNNPNMSYNPQLNVNLNFPEIFR